MSCGIYGGEGYSWTSSYYVIKNSHIVLKKEISLNFFLHIFFSPLFNRKDEAQLSVAMLDWLTPEADSEARICLGDDSSGQGRGVEK